MVRETKVTRADRETRDRSVFKAIKVTLANKATKVFRVTKVTRDDRETRASKAIKVTKETSVLKATSVSRETKDFKVTKA